MELHLIYTTHIIRNGGRCLLSGKFETNPLPGNLCNKNGLNVQMNKGDIIFERFVNIKSKVNHRTELENATAFDFSDIIMIKKIENDIFTQPGADEAW